MPGAGPRVRPRVLRGLVPWTVAAIVLLGAGSAGTVIADRESRQVNVTVVSADGRGHCRVGWTDPWSHRERRGPMDCPLTEWDHQLRAGDVVTEGVSGWPVRGQLYDATTGDDPLFVAAAWVAVAGAVLLAGVAAAAFYRRFRRRFPRRFVAGRAVAGGAVGPGAPSPRGGLPGAGSDGLPDALDVPGYAALAAAARAQWTAAGWDARTPPADHDVREVPWWRVRALRRFSEVLPGLVMLLLIAVSVATSTRTSVREVWPVVLTVVVGVLSVQLVCAEVRGAAELARAARSPFAEIRRYVAVRDTRTGALWMLLFPLGGDGDDLPQATLPLSSRVRTGGRRYGIPAAPVGEVELHSDQGRPDTVVPWSGGRPVWPAGPLVTVDPGDPELLARLRYLTSPGAGAGGRRSRRRTPPVDPTIR
ncbi:hypothetical protein SAMN05216267_103125 [Actinacidiphila rubida]|uniref:Uncharacterized protein n=1 Tax=Actinacidiphila rubida TaxID=310780 RepID=A0A1H8QS24_9ACTN|nr:hypothetical protein [Actinacidiphila rubida]SEO57060.1 hypothetical protein SAMN05216267_103125 [Actinacidiphila rubida]